MKTSICRYILLLSTFLGGLSAQAEDFAVVLIGVRDADNYRYIQDHAQTVARLNQGSAGYWNYVPIYLEYFDNINSELSSRGITANRAAIVAHARYENGVYTGTLRDFQRAGMQEVFTPKSKVQEYADTLYHCGMDNNNGIINMDHVGLFLKAKNGGNYVPWGAAPFDPIPTSIGTIVLNNKTFAVTAFAGATVIGDYNIVTTNFSSSVIFLGQHNTVISTGNNLLVFATGSHHNTVNSLRYGSLVNVANDTTTIVNSLIGDPGWVGFCGNDRVKLTANFSRVETINGAMGDLLLNQSQLFMANNNYLTLKWGSHNNQLTHNGHANLVTIEATNTGNTVYNAGPGDLLNVAGDTRTGILPAPGQRSNVGIIGHNAYVGATNQNIENAPGIGGIELGGTGNIFTLVSGGTLKVSGWLNSVFAHGNTSTHFEGTDNTLAGSYNGGNFVYLDVNKTHTVQGTVASIHFNIPATGTATTTLNTSGNVIRYIRSGSPAVPPVFTFITNGSSNQSTIENYGRGQLNLVHNGPGNKVQGVVVPSGQLYRDERDPWGGGGGGGTTIITTWYWWPSMVYITSTTKSDPFIMDFTGSKVSTQALRGSLASYDFDGDGKPNRTAWGLPGQGFLIHKKNAASTSIGRGEFVEGLQHLREVVGEDVAVLDPSHAAWSSLRVWVDDVGLGDVNNARLRTLDEVGITSINLGSASLLARDDNGNTVLGEGTFTLSNGDVRHWAGVNLQFEP